jgi:anaerobic magnesium-protoporphyrin IX monomethyl ester cyclase
MIQRKRRVVLFMPHRADPAQGVRVAADLTPLELLQIAAFPAAEGYEVVLVDAMIHDDYEQRLLEACDGALCFASSCILGYQVAHGAEVARKIRERFPRLPILWGGWFPSVLPELYLSEGIADAVGLGQGELTFWECVQALENGTDLADVPGLVVLRDGKPVYTPHRAVVGFDAFPKTPWHLLDYERYVARQNDYGRVKVRHKYPEPWDMPAGMQYRGFSHFSSFGCPEPCTFCCSPMVTGRRWKAIPGKQLAEELLDLQSRFRFNTVRFQDANFGVAEKRSNEFCQSLIDAGSPFWWNGTYEIETIARFKDSSLDLMAASKLHMAALGAEAGSQEQQDRIKKAIHIPDIEVALEKLNARHIQSGTSWIIGYPGESRESMMATLDRAAEMKHKFPRSASDIFPFRPIPGTEDFNTSVKLGYQPPKTLDQWGSVLEYKLEVDDIRLPMDVFQTWKRYGTTSTFYDGLVSEGSGAMRSLMRSISGWRLKNVNYRFPVEQKLFHWYVRLTGNAPKRAVQRDMTPGVTPHAPA